MIIAQFLGNAEHGIGHGVSAAADNALARGQACQHVGDVSMFAVNRDRHAGEAGRGNGFDCAPVARVDDVRAELAHDASEAEEQKLEFGFVAPGDENFILHFLKMREALVVAACGADAMIEFSAAQACHYFQDHIFRSTHIEAIDDVKNAEGCGPGGRGSLAGNRRNRGGSLSWSDCFHFSKSVRRAWAQGFLVSTPAPQTATGATNRRPQEG